MSDLFEKGATYRAKVAFIAYRDAFDPSEQLIFFHHAVSVYDGMEGWFFRVLSTSPRVRTWDYEIGAMPSFPFEKIFGVDPIVSGAASGDEEAVVRLSSSRAMDDAYVLTAMEAAIERGHAKVASVLANKISRDNLTGYLGQAASAGQLCVVEALLDFGIVSDGAVWNAIWSGSSAVVKLLIERGANPRRMGRTIGDAIAFCERQNHPEIATILARYR